MTRLRASIPFLKNDDNFLRLAITCHYSGIPASQRLGIRDEVLGLDLDYAVALRLLLFETERDKQRARLIALAAVGAFNGKDVLAEDPLDSDTIHPLAADDPYADSNTIIS